MYPHTFFLYVREGINIIILEHITPKPILTIHWMVVLCGIFHCFPNHIYFLFYPYFSFLFLVLLMLRSFICWTDLVSYHSPLWTNAIFCKDIYSIQQRTLCSDNGLRKETMKIYFIAFVKQNV